MGMQNESNRKMVDQNFFHILISNAAQMLCGLEYPLSTLKLYDSEMLHGGLFCAHSCKACFLLPLFVFYRGHLSFLGLETKVKQCIFCLFV